MPDPDRASVRASGLRPRSGFSPMSSASRASSVWFCSVMAKLLRQRKRTARSAVPHTKRAGIEIPALLFVATARPAEPRCLSLFAEQLVPAALLAVLPGPAVIGVRADQRHDRGGFGEDH